MVSNCLCLQRTAVSPMSPVIRWTRLTCVMGTSNASAIDASTRPSLRPMRISPEIILMKKRAGSGSRRRRIRSSGASFALPRAVRIASSVASTSSRETGSGEVRPSSASPAQSPRSECLRKSRPSSSSSRPEIDDTVLLTAAQPSPSVRRFEGLNARPLMKTAARRRSSSSSVRKYAARIRAFSRVADVAPTAEPACEKSIISAWRRRRGSAALRRPCGPSALLRPALLAYASPDARAAMLGGA